MGGKEVEPTGTPFVEADGGREVFGTFKGLDGEDGPIGGGEETLPKGGPVEGPL